MNKKKLIKKIICAAIIIFIVYQVVLEIPRKLIDTDEYLIASISYYNSDQGIDDDIFHINTFDINTGVTDKQLDPELEQQLKEIINTLKIQKYVLPEEVQWAVPQDYYEIKIYKNVTDMDNFESWYIYVNREGDNFASLMKAPQRYYKILNKDIYEQISSCFD